MRTFFQVKNGRLDEVKGEVVREQPLTVYVNGERFLTLLCSPFMLEPLVLGYLWMEKVIGSLDDVAGLQISEVDGRAEVTLREPVTLPTERILSACFVSRFQRSCCPSSSSGRSASERISLDTSRRSRQSSFADGRPQNQ